MDNGQEPCCSKRGDYEMCAADPKEVKKNTEKKRNVSRVNECSGRR